MNKTHRLFSLVLGSWLVVAGAGCHKKTEASAPKTLDQGVSELHTALASANAEVQSNFYHGVSYSLRYGDYASAAMAVQVIASDPSLNDQQKQAANVVGELLKQELQNQPGKPQ